MTAISSHRDDRASKMRVLILSAFLACAAAAPSGFLTPVVVPTVYSGLPVPTISPGDIQAAAINAQVKSLDLAIAAQDKAREQAEMAAKSLTEKVEESNDQVKEKVEEQFWTAEEQKWQALDKLKTAEAQIDGSVASNANLLAKSAIGPYVVPLPNIVGVAPIAPAISVVTPIVKAAEVKGEVKASEMVKSAEIKEETKDDSVAVEAEPAVKSEKIEDKPIVAPLIAPYPTFPIGAPIVGAPLVGTKLLGAPIVGAPIVGAPFVGAPIVGAPYVGAPVLQYSGLPAIGLNQAVYKW